MIFYTLSSTESEAPFVAVLVATADLKERCRSISWMLWRTLRGSRWSAIAEPTRQSPARRSQRVPCRCRRKYRLRQTSRQLVCHASNPMNTLYHRADPGKISANPELLLNRGADVHRRAGEFRITVGHFNIGAGKNPSPPVIWTSRIIQDMSRAPSGWLVSNGIRRRSVWRRSIVICEVCRRKPVCARTFYTI